jgi:hypothetical protein
MWEDHQLSSCWRIKWFERLSETLPGTRSQLE